MTELTLGPALSPGSLGLQLVLRADVGVADLIPHES